MIFVAAARKTSAHAAFVTDASITHQHAACRGKASGRAKTPQLHVGIISASLLPRPPLGKACEQADHAHEQRPDQHIQQPGDAVPGTARVDPETQFSLQQDKTFGQVGGVGFHLFGNI